MNSAKLALASKFAALKGIGPKKTTNNDDQKTSTGLPKIGGGLPKFGGGLPKITGGLPKVGLPAPAPSPSPAPAPVPTPSASPAPIPGGVPAPAPLPGGVSSTSTGPTVLPPPPSALGFKVETKEEKKDEVKKNEPPKPTPLEQVPEHLKKYYKMHIRMRIPLHAVKNSMIKAGVKFSELEPHLGLKKPEPPKPKPLGPVPDHLKKYYKMHKVLKIPLNAVKNSMIKAGLKFSELEPYFGIQSNKSSGGANIANGLPAIKKKPALPDGLKPKKEHKPTGKMRKLHWTKVKPTDVKGTVWAEIDDEKLNIDFGKFETLFGAKKTTKGKTKSGNNKSGKSKKKKKEVIEEICLVDGKRSYNVNIGLARFKMSHQKIKEAILKMDEQILNPDKIFKLVQYVPTDSEQETLRNFDGDPNHLANTEKFFFTLSSLSNLKKRMELWMFKVNFDEQFQSQNDKINILKNCYSNIKNSKAFKTILQYVLAFGNYMNAGTRKAGCYGFKLTSLKQLSSAKTIDNSRNLLQYLVEIIELENNEYINEFFNDTDILKQVTRMDFSQLQSDINLLNGKLNQINKLITSNKSNDKNDLFNNKMKIFYDNSIKMVQDLKSDFDKIQKELKILGDYYNSINDVKFEYLTIIYQFREQFKFEYDKMIRLRIAKEKEDKKRKAAEERLKSRKSKGNKKNIPKSIFKPSIENKINKKSKRKISQTPIGTKPNQSFVKNRGLSKRNQGSQSTGFGFPKKRSSSGDLATKQTNAIINEIKKKSMHKRKNTGNDDSDDENENNLTDNLLFGNLLDKSPHMKHIPKSTKRGLPPIPF